MGVAIYTRISDDRREGKAKGVKRQLKDCEARAQHLGWEVVKHYSDNDISARSGKRRPEYRQMLDDIAAGLIDGVIVWDEDRLVRQPRELEEFIDTCDKAGVTRLATIQGDLDLSTSDGRMYARIKGAIARAEGDKQSARIARKALEVAQDGGAVKGGDRPFGFEDDRVTLRPSEAKIVRELAERFLKGESLRSLAVDLNARGIRTGSGGEWQTHPLKRLLKSGRISGQRDHRGETYKAVWPAIITPEQTRQIRAKFADPTRRMTRPARSYLLKGLLRCSDCGAQLVARPRDDGARCYVCAGGVNFNGCGKRRVLAEPVEEFVTEALLARLDTSELAKITRGEEGDEHQRQADELQARLDELAEAYAAGAISMRDWLTAKGPLQARLDAAQRQVSQTTSAGVLGPFVGRSGVLRSQWPELSIERRNAIIGAAIERVRVEPGRRGFNRFDPSRFGLVWKA